MTNLQLREVTSYEEAMKLLGNRDYVPLGYKTKLVYQGDYVDVVHHSSSIVRYWSHGLVQFRNAGYCSSTTTHRINRLTPAGVYIRIRNFLNEMVTSDGVVVPFGGSEWTDAK